MANNRMYLVHVPTGVGVALWKRMGWGWYQPAGADRVAHLFEVLESEYGYQGPGRAEAEQDHFTLVMENPTGAPSCPRDWQYGPRRADGLVQFVWAADPVTRAEEAL